MGPSGAPTFRNLAQGYKEVMAKYPDIQIVFKTDGPLTRERGVKNAEDALVANPDLESDLRGQRRSRARRDAGGAGGEPTGAQTIVTGMNGVPPALKAVKDGSHRDDRRTQSGALGPARRRRARDYLKGDKVEPRVFIKHVRHRQLECRRGAGENGVAQEEADAGKRSTEAGDGQDC